MRKYFNNILISGFAIILPLTGSISVLPSNDMVIHESDLRTSVKASQQVNKATEEYKPDLSPILKKIAFCESNQRQFYEDGRIIKSEQNSNGTYDWGYFQINRVHLERAREMGYYIKQSKEDNIKFGKILYEEFGSEIWYGYIEEEDKCAWSDLDVDVLMKVYEEDMN